MSKKIGLAAIAALALSACGGGSDGEGASRAAASDSPRQELSIAPQAVLSASPKAIDLQAVIGQPATAEIALRYTGQPGNNAQLSIESLPAVFARNPLIQALGDGRFSVRLAMAAGLAAGSYSGSLKFTGCHDQNCKEPTKTVVVSVPYDITVTSSPVGDWQTFQGNAGHTGYVPVTLDPAKFKFAWQWRRAPGGVLGAINAVVTEGNKVFVTEDDYFSVVSLRALDEANGNLLWKKDFLNVPALNPPAVANGVVYAATTGHADTFLYGFRASDGAQVFKSPFDSQWANLLAPTLAGGRVYTNGGYYGGGVYSFNASTGNRAWAQQAGDDDMATPAVDGKYVYHYSGLGLDVYGVADGALVTSIPDPYGPASGYSYHAAPILGSPDNVIAFSGGAFSGRASSSTEQYDSRRLVNFSIQGQTTRWITQQPYLTAPALAKGVIYAGRNAPKSLDAISEATGKVLWSWTGTSADAEFHRNVVVTDNLAFVSTDRAVYAIDLRTRKSVWSYPVPGLISLSASGMLYIAEGANASTGRLIAVKLR
jgi:outer membrane protein assembly factor BamB